MLESNIFYKYTFMHENKKYNKKYLLTANNLFERKKTPNIKRLPNITKEKTEKQISKINNNKEENNTITNEKEK